MSRRYFSKLVIQKYAQRDVCLWNVSLKVCELQAAMLVTCELWTAIQPVCEMWAVNE